MKSLLIVLFCLVGLSSQVLLGEPAAAELLLKGQNIAETGFVTKADAGKIYFSASPTGRNERAYPKSLVARLTFKPPEGWREAEQAPSRGKIRRGGQALQRDCGGLPEC